MMGGGHARPSMRSRSRKASWTATPRAPRHGGPVRRRDSPGAAQDGTPVHRTPRRARKRRRRRSRCSGDEESGRVGVRKETGNPDSYIGLFLRTVGKRFSRVRTGPSEDRLAPRVRDGGGVGPGRSEVVRVRRRRLNPTEMILWASERRKNANFAPGGSKNSFPLNLCMVVPEP